MADYVLPSAVEKRVRYFDGQFLQDQDFIDEQKYQLDREHRHNRLLHGPGVAEGLTVASTVTLNQVTVAPGTAIDSDGNQLVLAAATTVDLPGTDYNDKQGVQIFISFLATASDQQTVGGSSDYTRWLERPTLTALAPGSAYAGSASPVLLATVALDSTGRVTQVDNGVRTYSGLLLPGPGAGPATLRATRAGQLELAGGLTVDGNLGVGTAAPAFPLHLAVGKALRIEGGDAAAYLSMGGNGALSIDAPGIVGGRFVVQDSGNVGIGTANPRAKLEVVGGGNVSVDLVVNGRLRSDNPDGGLWVSGDRFVGGFDGNKIGFYSGEAWQLAVLPNGNIGIGTSTPAFPLHLPVGKALRIEGGDAAAYLSMGGTGALSIDAPGVPGGRFVVQNSGNVGIGSANPGNDLEIGSFDARDRYLAFKVAGGNQHSSGIKMWAWQDNHGYSIQYDERNQPVPGLHMKAHGGDPNGTTTLFVGLDGNIGIGTVSPAAKLQVIGGGNDSVDLVVNGRLRSDSNEGGLWVSTDRFVGGFDTNKVGFYNGGAWQLAVLPDGNVGIGGTSPGFPLHLAGGKALRVEGGTSPTDSGAYFSFGGNGAFSIDAPGVAGGRFVVQNSGDVGIGTTNTSGQKLCVAGSTWVQSDLFVSGRLVYADGGGQWWHIHPQESVGTWWAANDGTGGPSDVRLKTDVRPVTEALSLVRKLQAVRYRWGERGLSHFTRDIETKLSAGPDATDEEHQRARDTERGKALDALGGDRLGLVAQEVESVLPELVHDDADGYKRVRYQHLTALLAEAIKEQDAVVRALSAEIAELRAEGARLSCGSR